MPHVSVTIAGRTYRMACDEGQEKHLEALAAQVDAKIAEIRGAFGEIGDQRITVMSALTFADELAEARRRADRLEAEIAALRETQDDARKRNADRENEIARMLGHSAERLEHVARLINAGSRG